MHKIEVYLLKNVCSYFRYHWEQSAMSLQKKSKLDEKYRKKKQPTDKVAIFKGLKSV